MTAVRGKKYLQVAKNRYSGDLGIVPLDFDKDSLSYQAKKKNKIKQDEPDKLLNQCFEEFSVDERNYLDYQDNLPNQNRFPGKLKNPISKNKDADSYLRNILNMETTR